MDDDNIASERRRSEAAQWFARLKTLPVSHGTLRDFFAWKRNKPNADAFAEAERFWTEADKVGERPSILRAVEAAAAQPARGRRLTVFRLVPAIAAAIVVVLVGYLYIARLGPTYETDPGELRAVALDDGSRLRLSTRTNVAVRYSSSAREIVLREGQALFTVAREVSRPFTVKAGDVTVTATGTQFDVAHHDRQTSVTLIEGRVVVRAPDGRLFDLRPGQQWRWPAVGNAVATVNPGNVTAWTQGRIVMDNMSLADAIDEVNRYGGTPIVLDAPALANRRISGTFEAGDVPSFVTAVTAFLPLRERHERGTIRLGAGEQNMREYTSDR
ncbi:FecR family protein [Sphingomonas adhaesiva]|uniref:FecR family protein n=1 Tax=Sphingomonas adhaesiva TaxID=28212 RepID=UPI002FF941D3